MSDLRRGKPRRIRQKVGMVNVRRAVEGSQWMLSHWESEVRADERERLGREAQVPLVHRAADGVLSMTGDGPGWTPVAMDMIRDWIDGHNAAILSERERIADALARKWSDAMGRYREKRTTYWEGQTDALDAAERIARGGGAAS